MDKPVRRRLPAIERIISELNPDKDVRVRLLGTVIGNSDSTLVIDDGSGRVEIAFDDSNAISGIADSAMVRVIARILPLTDGFECRGECVQVLNNFDIKLWRRVRDACKQI